MKIWPIAVQNAMRQTESPAGGCGVGDEDGPTFTLRADGGHPPSMAAVIEKETMDEPQYVVRRLLPTEAEALQGFPRGYTDVEFNGRPAPDTARYRALGNSFSVNVVRWIAERIVKVEKEGLNPELF